MTVLICAQNNTATATLTESSAQTGYPAANCVDYLPVDFWSPNDGAASIVFDFATAKECNYIGIAGHNLSGILLTLARSSDGISYTTVTSWTPSSNGVQLKTFTGISYRYWKLSFTAASSKIGHISIGKSLTMDGFIPSPFTPPKHGANYEFQEYVTEGGNFGGLTRRATAIPLGLNLQLLTPSWIETNYQTLLTDIKAHPFFVLWDQENYPSDPAYMWLTDPPMPEYSSPLFMNLRLMGNCAV